MGFDFGNVDMKHEFIAALTVFLASSYILFLNPGIMHDAGIDLEGAFFATALAAAAGTLLIGLIANKPYVIAPGMTLNIFFTYTLVKTYGISWQVGVAAVIFSGVILLALSLTSVRVWFSQAIPSGIKKGILGGVGLLLVFVGLMRAQLVVPSAFTIVGLGNILSPEALLAVFGLIITCVLFLRNIRGAFLFGMLATTLLSILVHYLTGTQPALEIFGLPHNLDAVAFKFDIAGLTSLSMLGPVLALFMVAFFDTIGTSTALLTRASKGAKKIKTGEMEKIMVSDSLATIVGGILGTSPQAVYVESAAAQDAGGKTGLVSVFVALFFLLSLFFFPLMKLVPIEATAAVLIIVGLLMFGSMKNIDMKDYSESLPALLCLAAIPMTFSVTYGIGIAAIAYVALKIFTLKFKDVHPGMYITALLFLLEFLGFFR
ncbi:MAG: NCS2 family permease [Candidatus ainarchaeum sp.]|nr:NCS2 family permease [Candidatus ainarchaeum sp.]